MTLLATREVPYKRPHLYDAQFEAIFCDERYGVVEASTKSGKTVGCIVWLHEQAALYGGPGKNFWWVAPIFSQAKIAYRRLRRFLPAGSYSSNETELTVTLANGAIIWFKGAERPDSLFGEDVYAAVIDEATRVREESWHAVRTTLTATQGPVRIIGNVKGRRNWAYQVARKAEQGEPNHHYARLTAWDAVRGGVLAKEEIEDARRTLPEAVFLELYMAEASDDGSNPFGLEAIAACVAPVDLDGTPAVWGWDLAKRRDWTAGIALDYDGHTVRSFQWQLPWGATVTKIKSLTGLVPALVDASGVGDPIVEELQRGGGNYQGFKFTSVSRQMLMEGLAMKISQRAVTFPQDVADQLETFEYVYMPTGVKYACPEGLHDDGVMALALALQLLRDSGPPRVRFL